MSEELVGTQNIKLSTVHQKEYYMDGYLSQVLNRARKLALKDRDIIGCYDGYEGDGKSVKAMQDAYFVDPTFNVERECFTAKQFHNACTTAEPYQAVVYDEAYSGLSSRGAMSTINRALVRMLSEIRQKRLFIFLVLPSFFDLDKYAALWRTRYLVHVYTEAENDARGYFEFYDRDRKKMLYLNGKKTYNYGKPKPNFRGRFTNFYPIDEKEYRKRKKDALHTPDEAELSKEDKKKVQFAIFERLLEDEDLTIEKKADLLGITMKTWYVWKERYHNEGKLWN